MTRATPGVDPSSVHDAAADEVPSSSALQAEATPVELESRPDTSGFVRSTSFSITARWVVIGLSSLGAFWPSVVRTAEDLRGGDLLGYIFVMPFLAAVAAIGIARRRTGELPIHDRQIDSIVGGMGMVLAVAVQWLLLPRYAEQFSLLRIDLLSWLLFVVSAAVLLFGLRPVGRFWPVWLMVVVIAPLPYRMVVVMLGGQSQHVSVVLIFLAAAAVAIAVGRTRRRGVIGAIATVVVGIAGLVFIWFVFPDAPRPVVQFVPAGVAAVTVGLGMYLQHGYLFSDRRAAYSVAPRRPTAVGSGLVRSGLVVVAVAVLLSFFPLPDPPSTVIAQGPPRISLQLTVPNGWKQENEEQFDWADRFFGRHATLVRQTIVANDGNSDWDAQSRPRRVVIDTLDTWRPASLTVYPTDTLYRLTDARRSPAVPVDLGHGVQGELSTIVDENALLTWSLLSFTWMRGGLAQRVNLITVDDHRPDAIFPQPRPSMASDVTNTLNVLFRGNAVTVDENPQYKDLDMLTVLGTQLVDAQWKVDQ
ncbi:hypothetical protein ERC79_11190 [Rhodococcus sp. ABRD24]|uniref:hypothetical protein n=1 Tax=Rhodococcus sp. ABRD24 TaxID=2507582 RepID=UPI001038F499|nr:hypothetical protein [Rhodococcus sp. ABRD24]QBJ96458.1 hypothetical protein ERC79_11190 [Rhodococcus sp. ABRD24]